MKDICQSVKKKDHDPKIEGRSVYVDDYNVTASGKPILCGRLLHSPYAKARVLSVSVPELPEGYFWVDRSDIPGDNNVNIVLDDTPVFCRETVEYIGEPVGMLAGPDEKTVEELLGQVRVDYEELEPMLDLRNGTETFFNYEFGHGDIHRAFAEADKVYEEEFFTGYQDQTYLEPQGMMAEPEADGRMFVHGSLQCPYYVHGAVARAMGTGPDGVHILQDVTGGGFGGKEDFPSILGCQVAVAAKKAGQPVRCVYNRREDLEFTPKRHPALSIYKVAVKDGRVTAVDAAIRFDAGAYSTLSAVVLQRGIIAAPGVYDIPNVHVTGKAVKTNTVPCGAYRGFGAPQTFFAMEMMMDHIAQDLGEDSIEFKQRHFAKQGDMTSTQGRYHFPVPIPAMLSELDEMSDVIRKHKEYAKPQSGRYRRGIGFSAIFHGAGFTGLLTEAVRTAEQEGRATVFGYWVSEPQRYGVAEFDRDGNCLSIEEKPAKPKSNYAVVGLYFYPNKVVDVAATIKPSARGELEITSVNQAFLNEGLLKVQTLGRGFAWLDTGTHDSLAEASIYIETIEKRQGLKVACLEGIGFSKGWISADKLREIAAPMAKNQYGQYLLKLADDPVTPCL